MHDIWNLLLESLTDFMIRYLVFMIIPTIDHPCYCGIKALQNLSRCSWILYKISILNRDACMSYVDGLAQDCSNSIAIALELLQS